MKAIAVFNAPENCSKCPCYGGVACSKCNLSGQMLHKIDPLKEVGAYCPLEIFEDDDVIKIDVFRKVQQLPEYIEMVVVGNENAAPKQK